MPTTAVRAAMPPRRLVMRLSMGVAPLLAAALNLPRLSDAHETGFVQIGRELHSSGADGVQIAAELPERIAEFLDGFRVPLERLVPFGIEPAIGLALCRSRNSIGAIAIEG